MVFCITFSVSGDLARGRARSLSEQADAGDGQLGEENKLASLLTY